ncbi:MAG: DUF2306 domain-containing protein [Terricaulis sp.]
MTALDAPARTHGSAIALHWSGVALVAITWISAAIFGAYIIAFYGGAIQDGTLEVWNTVLPRLYETTSLPATIAIGAHFATGAILLLLGPVQLIGAVRARARALHRWIGRLYASCALIAGIGGLVFIFSKGTIGGVPMNIGFGLYGALMVLTAVQTVRHAMARRLELHRSWAIRLFALAIGSWLYRLDYGFWSLLTGGIGHTESFDGWFDVLMAFFFYLPNLAIAELFIRARRWQGGPALRLSASAALIVATGFVSLGTYYFTLYAWAPAIAARF